MRDAEERLPMRPAGEAPRLARVAPAAAGSTQATGVLIVALGVVVLSFESTIVGLLHLSAWTILLWRGSLMAIGLTTIFWLGWARGGALRGVRAAGGCGLVVAVLFACDNVLFILALRTTSVANTLIILSTAPAWSGVLSWVLLGERGSARTWIVTVVALAGVAAIFSGSLGHGHPLGDLAAFGAAGSLAGALVLARRARSMVTLPSMALGGLLAAAVAAPFARPALPTGSEALLLGLLGLVIAPVAFGCVSAGLRYLPAQEVGLLMLLETVLGPFWALLILHQPPGAAALLGGAVIVPALLVNGVLSARQRNPPPAGRAEPRARQPASDHHRPEAGPG
jgi:drug/metabolite transporter (DMT)-like permease